MNRLDMNQQESKNPVQKYLSFKGSTGEVTCYDRDKKENVVVKNPTLTILDIKNCVTGWSDAEGTNIYSNVIGSSVKEEFNVRVGNKDLAKGFWSDIKLQVKAAGGNYTNNIYAIMTIDKDFEIVVLQLKRSGISGWSDFTNGLGKYLDIYSNSLEVGVSDIKKKGTVEYFEPTFKLTPFQKGAEEAADQAASVLKEYFNSFIKDEGSVEVVPPVNPITTESGGELESDGLPF
jgi:hypothetical protein